MNLPKRKATCLTTQVGNETLVYHVNESQKQAHCLSPIAGVVFKACDGTSTDEQVVASLMAETGEGKDVCQGYLQAALEELSGLGLLEESADDGIGRREFFAKTGTIAAAVTLVTTVGLPSPAAARSDMCANTGATNTQSCQQEFGVNTKIDSCLNVGTNGLPCAVNIFCTSQHVIAIGGNPTTEFTPPNTASVTGDPGFANSCAAARAARIALAPCTGTEASCVGQSYFCCSP